jgi:hypothetical protein
MLYLNGNIDKLLEKLVNDSILLNKLRFSLNKNWNP